MNIFSIAIYLFVMYMQYIFLPVLGVLAIFYGQIVDIIMCSAFVLDSSLLRPLFPILTLMRIDKLRFDSFDDSSYN